jgi:hypothetical protein
MFRDGALPWLEENLKDRPRWALLYGGSLIAPTKICRELTGWDEVIEDWGAEDDEFWFRLDARLTQMMLPRKYWVRLRHDEESRVSFFRVKDRNRSNMVNHRYTEILWELAADGVVLPIEKRRRIYDCVRRDAGLLP